jgi:L-alanine-DL-glutamate epimerase-like enolase superfamily enzyme
LSGSSLQLNIRAHDEMWPLAEAFTISRGSKMAAHTIVAEVSDGAATGRGEAVPYARYGETVTGELARITALGAVASRAELLQALPAGAARNAVDCAFWDFEAKYNGISVAETLGCGTLRPVVTAFTLSLAAPDAMAAKARSVPELPLLKLKLGGPGDAERMRAVRAARPDARLIADANEAWTAEMLDHLMGVAAELRFETIEQPLPEHDDEILRGKRYSLPVCADESVKTAADLPRLSALYDAVNIKLDKAGGLTAALDLHTAARTAGLKIMVGSMVATSLAAAPALILAQDSDWADLDGPLLLLRDRDDGLDITNGLIMPPGPKFWG